MNEQHTVPQSGNALAPDSRMVQTDTGLRVERRRKKTVDESARDRALSRTHHHREFGVGYGESDGYADDEKYADSWAKASFRIS